MRKAVKVIAVLATLGSVVYFIIGCIQLSMGEIKWFAFLTAILSLVLNLVLLWALHNALTRIEDLEEDVGKTKNNQRKLENSKTIYASDRPNNQFKTSGSFEIKKNGSRRRQTV